MFGKTLFQRNNYIFNKISFKKLTKLNKKYINMSFLTTTVYFTNKLLLTQNLKTIMS